MKNSLGDLNNHLFATLERLNDLGDLNNHLFVALERLNDEDLKGDDLNAEVSRSQAVVGVAEAILHNADTQLRAVKLLEDLEG